MRPPMMPSVIAAAVDSCTYSGDFMCGARMLLFGRYTPAGGMSLALTGLPFRRSTGVFSGSRGAMTSNAL